MSKAIKPKGEVMEVEAEEIGHEIAASDIVKKAVNEGLDRLEPYKKRMEELKEQYSSVTIADVEDKEGYEKAKQAVRELRSIRVNSGKDKKVGKAPLLAGAKSIEEKDKLIQEGIAAIEDPIQKRIDEIDAEREKIKAEKKRKQDEQLMIRQQTLTKLGAEYRDGNFVLGEVSFDAAMIREVDQEIWESDILPLYQAHFDKVESEKAEAKRIEDEKAAELKRQQDELKKQQEELKRQQDELAEANRQAEIAKQKKEEEEKRELVKVRTADLEAMGFKYAYSQGAFIRGDARVNLTTVENAIPENWVKVLDKTKQIIEALDKSEKEEQEANEAKRKAKLEIEATGKARKSILAALEVNYGTIEHWGSLPTQEWESLLKDFQTTFASQQAEKLEREKQEKERERLAELEKANDKEKRAAFLEQLRAISIPGYKSPQYKRQGAQDEQAINGILQARVEIKNQYSK